MCIFLKSTPPHMLVRMTEALFNDKCVDTNGALSKFMSKCDQFAQLEVSY